MTIGHRLFIISSSSLIVSLIIFVALYLSNEKINDSLDHAIFSKQLSTKVNITQSHLRHFLLNSEQVPYLKLKQSIDNFNIHLENQKNINHPQYERYFIEILFKQESINELFLRLDTLLMIDGSYQFQKDNQAQNELLQRISTQFENITEDSLYLVAKLLNKIKLEKQYENNFIYVLLFIMTFVLSLISYVMTISIRKRLRLLNTSLNKISSGVYDIQLDVHDNDEISALSCQFNKMAHSLNSSINEVINQAEDLNLMNERFQLLLYSTAESIIGIDMQGICIFCNPSAVKLLGYKHESQILGRMIAPIIYQSNDLEKLKKCPLCQSHQLSTPYHSTDEIFKTVEQREIPVEVWSYPMLKDQDAIGSVITFFDQTEKIKAADKITQLSQAVEQSPISIVITDLDGNIEYTNSSFTCLTGYSNTEAFGMNYSILSSGQTDEELYRDLWSTISSGKTWIGEIQNKKKNGKLYWERLKISPLFNSQKKITHYLSLNEDITQARELEQKIHQQAYYDLLTGLPNRFLILDRLCVALKNAQRSECRLALLFIDLNKFKLVNDTYGHEVGDLVLQNTANRIQDSIRLSDTVGRLAGDEFIVIIEKLSAVQNDIEEDKHLIKAVAKKINQSFNRPITVNNYEIAVSVSIGVAISPEQGNSSKELLHYADLAMYQSKESTGHDIYFYHKN